MGTRIKIGSADDAARHRIALKRLALQYLSLGLKVVPLYGITNGVCQCGRTNCGSPGKHPLSRLVPAGEHSASGDRKTVLGWLRQFPQANIGIAVGNGMVVVDIDGRKGIKSWENLGLRIRTAEVVTGRGRHIYFAGEGSTKIGVLPGIDFKGNGYVVAAPSRHVSGRRYEIKGSLDLLARLPAEMARLVKSGKAEDLEDHFSEGSRNAKLTQIAGSLVRQRIVGPPLNKVLRAVNQTLCLPPLAATEVSRITQSVSRYVAEEGGPEFQTISSVQSRIVRFLWDPRMPLGFMTMLDGRPGLGKSMLLTYLAARITRGQSLPFSDSAPSGNVLILSVEDPPAEVMRPRLERFYADLERVRFADRPFVLDRSGLDYLDSEMGRSKPRLVVIDPLFAYMGEKTDAYRANEVMPFMYRLGELAKRHNSAIVGVRHLTKSVQDDVLNAGIGSIGFIGAVRSGLLLAEHPDDRRLLVLAHTKHNLSAGAPAIVFRRSDSRPGELPKLKFLHTEDIDAKDLVSLGRAESGRPPEKIEDAKDYLRGKLGKGLVPSQQLFNDGEARGYSRKTLRRALSAIGAQPTGHGPGVKWALGSE